MSLTIAEVWSKMAHSFSDRATIVRSEIESKRIRKRILKILPEVRFDEIEEELRRLHYQRVPK